MVPVAGSDYLETEVMTATPQRLQLMLLDAVIRSANQARYHFERQNYSAALTPNLRAQRIMGELLVRLNSESKDELVRRMAAVYLFIYRSLVAANLERSTSKLDDALRVLDVERETWRSVCEQLGSEQHDAAGAGTTFAMGTSFQA